MTRCMVAGRRAAAMEAVTDNSEGGTTLQAREVDSSDTPLEGIRSRQHDQEKLYSYLEKILTREERR